MSFVQTPTPLKLNSWVVAFSTTGNAGSSVGSPLGLHVKSSAPEMLERDGITVVFDGMLYNAEAMATLVNAPPLPDADLILRAYQEMGEAFLPHLRGVFALIILDQQRDIVLCARDTVGIYPLFYAFDGSTWWISTHIDDILEHFPAKLNHAAVMRRLAHRWEDEFLYDGIHRLLAGHQGVISGNSIDIRRYWKPYPDDDKFDWIEEDAPQLFHQLFEQALERTMQLGRPGIFLSGGLDSIGVALYAHDVALKQNLPLPMALSVSFPGLKTDESPIQIEVARRLNFPQFIDSAYNLTSGKGILELALEQAVMRPGSLLNVWVGMYVNLSLIAKAQGCTHILMGSGGDEWLGVTPLLAQDLLRAFDFAGLLFLWRSNIGSYSVVPWRHAKNLLWTNGLAPIMRDKWYKLNLHLRPTAFREKFYRARIQNQPQWIGGSAEMRALFDADTRRWADRLIEDVLPNNTYLHMARTFIDHPMTSMEMEENFESARQTGMLRIHPYWDTDLISMLFRTSPQALLRSGRSKTFVRERVAERLPGIGLEHQRKVITADFLKQLVETEGRTLWAKIGGAKALADYGIVDFDTTNAMMESILSGQKGTRPYWAWDVMSVETWVRERF